MTDHDAGGGAAILARHAARGRRHGRIVWALAAAAAAVLIDLSTGPSGVGPADLWRALTGHPTLSPGRQVIIWQLRLPVAALAALVGAALALAGAEMQTVLDNPLASPFTLGVSAAAAFGAAIAIVFGAGLTFLPPDLLAAGNAFLFAFGALGLIQLLMRGRGADTTLLVLFGIALVFTFNALVAMVQFVAPSEALKQFVLWGMGDLTGADPLRVGACAAALALALPFSLRAAPALTALRLGAERAASLGIDLRRLRLLSLLRISLLTATAVAAAGTIGFAGLVAPHVARMLVGEDHRHFLPASVMTGALLVSLASTLSKTLIPGVQLPVGIVTSLVGLPLFFLLIHRSGRG